MELIRGLHNLRPRHRGCVATIGNFDGLHRGHRAVIGQLQRAAEAHGLPGTLITFEPLPLEYFLGERAPSRLSRLRDKVTLLRALGVERLLVLPFDRRLAEMPAEDFVRRVLVEGLGVRHLVVGDDFRFGKGRSGDFALLRRAGAAHGFSVEDTETLADAGGRISSTRVRAALAAGDFAAVQAMLGRPYTMGGHVIHGDKRGRQIGFHTANIRVGRRVSPLRGVYAVTVEGAADAPLPGVCNIGRRPTIGGDSFLLEVHLLDFDGDLYGRHLEVHFRHHLRGERKFESLDALVAQIHRDVAAAREFFRGNPDRG